MNMYRLLLVKLTSGGQPRRFSHICSTAASLTFGRTVRFPLNNCYYFKWNSISQIKKISKKWTLPKGRVHEKIYFCLIGWLTGVLVWEIFSFGDTPYSPKSPAEVTNAVVNKKFRLSCPNICPDGIYKLIRLCWRTFAADRPTFSQVSHTLLRMQDSGVYSAWQK